MMDLDGVSSKRTPSAYPFQVWVLLGGTECIVAGYRQAEEAKTDAAVRNAKAHNLGLKSRYEVRERFEK